MNIFDYIPYMTKLYNHQQEISELKTILTPTIDEFNKVKVEALALVTKLTTLLAPTLKELTKVKDKAIPLAMKIYTGMTS